MSDQDLFKTAAALEQEINKADTAGRLKLQPELSRVIALLQAKGERVPLKLRRLEATLAEDAVEARFDNFPV